MKEEIILLSILLLVVGAYSTNDFYASITHLEDFFNYEKNMIFKLEDLVLKLQGNLEDIIGYLGQIKKNRNRVADISLYLQNPLNSFDYMRSLYDYTLFLSKSFGPIWEIHELFTNVDSLGVWPTFDEVEEAASAILRLQSTYNLNIDQIVEGNILGFQSTHLDAKDCMIIGSTSNKKGDKETANKWMKKAFELCHLPDNMSNCNTLNVKINITEHYAYSEFENGNLKTALELTNYILELEPQHERAQINRYYLSDEIHNVPPNERTGMFMVDPYGVPDLEKQYFYCCRGMTQRKINVSKLKCHYEHYNNPYLIIGPIKVEEANLEPRIVIIKDIIYDSEIDEIKHFSKSKLERSLTQSGVQNDVRVSKVAWLESNDSELADKLITRFSIYSDLSPLSAESLQVVNYGLGGHYLPHFDAFGAEAAANEWGSAGNRIATLLVYLNAVDLGGDTAFTDLGLSVEPEKGTAVLWYNLLNNGDIDTRTLHAACPIIIGNKWAINLWFHEGWNEFKKPCLPQK